MSNLDNRLKKVADVVAKKADAALITSEVNRFYVFGFKSSAGYGYISAKRAVLALDFRYYEKALIAQKNGEISADVCIIEANRPRKDVLCEYFEADNVSTLLYEDRRTTCSNFKELSASLEGKVKLVAAENTIEALRSVKDADELEKIMRAQSITDAAFTHICGFIKKGMTENEISLELEYFMKKNGADGLAFNNIVVSGTKSSMPHGEPDNTVVGDGFLTMDFGARYKGYCSDMTRTVCIGTPDAEMKKIYDTVLAAQNAAFDVIRAGIIGKDADAAARNVINSAGFEGCFGHSLGHSLGIEVHETPGFSPNEKQNVPCGAVVSVEPGIYIAGKCGVRIEDIVFLTENGYKNLTNSTKEFIILK